MRAIIFAAFALSLFSCSSNNNTSTYPIPGPGQWASAFGKASTVLGTTFPMQPAPGVHYVYTPASSLALGKTISLTYTLDGNAVLTHDDPTDIDPPTISLFIWERGDNLSCAGSFAGYRQFGVGAGHANLELGTHTISTTIDAANWTGCYGQNAGYFNQAVANAAFMGFTLSGQYFAGHGVDLASGSATFTINAFSVQ